MKRFFLMSILAVGLAFTPQHAEAASSRQQVMVTTTAVGAATGAMIGSGSHQTLEGAIIGGMIGAAAGIILTPRTPTTTYRTAYQPQPGYRHGYIPPVHHTNRRHLHRIMHYTSYHPIHARQVEGQHAYHEYREHEAREFAVCRHAARAYQYDDED